jgi:hypothetical protein
MLITHSNREKAAAQHRLAALIEVIVDATLKSRHKDKGEMVMMRLDLYKSDEFDELYEYLEWAAEEDDGYYDPDADEEEARRSALFAAERARLGDWQPLIDYMQSNDFSRHPLPEELRDVLTKILKGKLKRLRSRPLSTKSRQRVTEMYGLVLLLERKGVSTESAVAEVAEKFKVNVKTVYRAMGRCDPHDELLPW